MVVKVTIHTLKETFFKRPSSTRIMIFGDVVIHVKSE